MILRRSTPCFAFLNLAARSETSALLTTWRMYIIVVMSSPSADAAASALRDVSGGDSLVFVSFVVCGFVHGSGVFQWFTVGVHSEESVFYFDLSLRQIAGVLNAGRASVYMPATASARPAREMRQEGGGPAVEWESCDFIIA
ncbi:hypothetical protein EVAR_57835_1 [Eumeta japonica]|uniref:Uncharacterized protein n=1 Tax=Eumeta variegata TaxID=151549 RepID=A0A4C1YWC9_EUMVA|nr:hypothetical protein EVAR_57835_1 [Eumeta japonica]